VDQEILSAIKSLDWRRVVRLDREIMKRGVPGLSCTMCATPAVVTVMEAARRLGAKARILHYANSGDVPGGDKARVVGYGSVVFYIERERKEGRIMFSEKAKEKLLQIARDTIEAHLKGLKAPEFETDLDELEAKSGCFVTLRNKGRLRGCIGCFTSDKPLYRTVQDMAISSTQDSRFVYNPVTLDEMQEIEIEISVLSPLKRISSPDEIELGVHGVWIKKGFRSGVFLPQVAHETGWDKKTFLENLCTHKAGLAKDAYKDPETELYTFTVEIIEEEKD
jgi:AmmeMemoRadiSam system protein A